MSTEAVPAPVPATTTEPAHTHPLTVLVTVLRSIPALLGVGVVMVAQSGAGQWVGDIGVAWWWLLLGSSRQEGPEIVFPNFFGWSIGTAGDGNGSRRIVGNALGTAKREGRGCRGLLLAL